MNEPSESQQLLRQAAAGDVSAFERLLKQHQAMIWSMALRFLRDRRLAEEVAQDVFLELFRSIGEIKSAEHLVFWLRRVTNHRCIDKARRERSNLTETLDGVERISMNAAQNTSDPVVTSLLRDAIRDLPEAPRMVMILRYQQDLDPGEISAVLNMSVNTVKSHLRRSVAILREQLTSTTGGACA